MDHKSAIALIAILAHDRKLARALADVLVEATRPAKAPEGVWPARTLPSVAANPQAIAEAKQRVAAMHEERQKLIRRKRTHGTTVAEDTRADELIGEIEIANKRIAFAERMIMANGGPHG
jgi:hypothetical protein